MFFFKKRKPKEAPKPAAAVDAQASFQKRGTYRADVQFPIWYAVKGRAGYREAIATDLSAGGLRLAIDEDLFSGTVVELRFTLPNTVLEVLAVDKEEMEVTPFGNRPVKKKQNARPFEQVDVSSEIVVTFFNIGLKRFEHGVKFVDIDTFTQEEVQRWIHGWQLLKIRQRATRLK